MENLKSVDVPALVTNLEVRNILFKRLQSRNNNNYNNDNEQDDNEQNNYNTTYKKTHPKLRHRDYIEQSVFDYLQQTPCGNYLLEDEVEDMNKMSELVSKLRSTRTKKSKKDNGSWKNKKLKNTETIKAEEEQMCNESVIEKKNSHTKEEEQEEVEGKVNKDDNYGLTDAETLQILNHLPTLPVELHLIIDDLESRLSNEQQKNLLELISSYSGTQKSRK